MKRYKIEVVEVGHFYRKAQMTIEAESEEMAIEKAHDECRDLPDKAWKTGGDQDQTDYEFKVIY